MAPDPYIFFWIDASAGEIFAGNLNGMNTILANGVTTLSVNGEKIWLIFIPVNCCFKTRL